MIVRKIMDYIFTQNELFYLDQVYPKHEKNEKDENKASIKVRKKTFSWLKINKNLIEIFSYNATEREF